MARRTLHLPALLGTLAAAVLVACAVVLLALSEKAEATFPGKNGRIAYSFYDGNDYEIYTTNSRGGDKFQVTNNNRDDYGPSYSPDGKRIAYVEFDRNDAEIYTIKVGGEVRPNSPTTTRTKPLLPTRQTARRSSTWCTATPPGTRRSTRSTPSEGVV